MTFQSAVITLERAGRQLNRATEWACALLIAAMIVIVWIGIGGRYVTDAGASWTEESARYVMIWAALLAVSCAAWRREHIGLDLLTSKLPAGSMRAIRIGIDLICITFFGFLTVYGIEMTREGATQFSTLFGLSMQLPFAAVPVSSALAAFQFLVRLATDLGMPPVETSGASQG